MVINVKVLKLQIVIFLLHLEKAMEMKRENLMVKNNVYHGCIAVATCKSNEKSITEAVIKWHVCILKREENSLNNKKSTKIYFVLICKVEI